jgi:hypothetical protein
MILGEKPASMMAPFIAISCQLFNSAFLKLGLRHFNHSAYI